MISIIPLSMVNIYDFPYDSTPTKCIMANIVYVESYGEATLNVFCLGSASQFLYIILELNNVLVRIYWFRAYHAYLTFDENRISGILKKHESSFQVAAKSNAKEFKKFQIIIH